MSWYKKIISQEKPDSGQEPADDHQDEGFVEDRSGKSFWGSKGSGILWTRQHPQLGNQILLTLRSANVLEPNTWGIPGGAVPKNMDLFASAIKETEEEILSLPMMYDRINQYVYKVPDGDFEFTTFICRTRDFNWNPTTGNWEVSKVAWVNVDGSQKMPLHPGVRTMLNSMKGYI